MSILDEINKRVADGSLSILGPAQGDPFKRTLALTPGLVGLLTGPWPDLIIERRCGKLRADLEYFVKGEPIAMSLTPYEHKTAFMGRLDKPQDEVWDIRSRDPDPGLRVFGRYAALDVFVAMICAPRSVEQAWLQRRALKEGTSLEWHFAILECQEIWKSLFPNHEPIHGDAPSDYATNAFLV